MNTGFDKVFISYASEDYKIAIQLFDFLTDNGFNPWLDKIKISPGQQWDIEIMKALREADYIIILLSDISVNKRGYVQKEFKLAASYISEKLHSDIYIIPCKLDECTVPHFLSHLQWVHYSDNTCFNKILNSLIKQRTVYKEDFTKTHLDGQPFSFKITKKSFNPENNPDSSAEVSYFQFNDESNEELIEINEYVKEKASQDFRSGRKTILEESQSEFALNFRELHGPMNFSSEVNYKISYLSNHFISIDTSIYNYMGGAHGNYANIVYNFSLSPFAEITNEELFSSNLDALSYISHICKSTIVSNVRTHLDDPSITENDCFMIDYSSSFMPVWENFRNFSLSEKHVKFIFNPYDVTAYVLGQHIIPISYEALLIKFPDLHIIRKLNNETVIHIDNEYKFL